MRKFTEIQCGIRENANLREGIRDSTPLVQFWEGPELYYPTREACCAKILAWDAVLGKKMILGIAMAEVRDAGLS